MSWSEIVVVVGAVVLVVGWRLWVSASRLDRLHRKVASSRAVVDAQLLRRASAAANLAASGLMDPVSSLLVGEAAWAAVAAGSSSVETFAQLPAQLAELGGGVPDAPDPECPPRAPVDVGLVESELSSTLRAALDDAQEVTEMRAELGGDELVSALADAWYRAQLARRFHNEAVAQTQRVRRGWPVRAFRLAGRAPVPQTLELDDAWPQALGRPGQLADAPGRADPAV
ncbi:hypothetical protein DDP54_17405 [Cellulomonas sp. WB94]|uniref:hypothetical protein n=1 Tax=Cellulomonas sp. WB94 TaxID=2173174 RepID=UPI000D5634DB|nr:hypothetical protein [Cellulomonas sp. WB94]PVU81128.1 hypothetical protein DDP54_17405 [Cellulomonas sp. WB94]